MVEEIRGRIKLLEEKRTKCEVGSVQWNMFGEILTELEDKLRDEMGKTPVKLHKESEQVCESCQ